jgi:hypothetical protein
MKTFGEHVWKFISNPWAWASIFGLGCIMFLAAQLLLLDGNIVSGRGDGAAFESPALLLGGSLVFGFIAALNTFPRKGVPTADYRERISDLINAIIALSVVALVTFCVICGLNIAHPSMPFLPLLVTADIPSRSSFEKFIHIVPDGGLNVGLMILWMFTAGFLTGLCFGLGRERLLAISTRGLLLMTGLPSRPQ